MRIETLSGPVEGEAVEGVSRWLGIPYARARRFEAPRPVDPWQNLRSANAFAPQCPQLLFGAAKRAKITAPSFGEDCLALNVWVTEGSAPNKPVMVWFHGGGFTGGSGDMYDGSELARSGDMVVVTVNYRLGVLGFINFGEALGLPTIPSNLGLRDQIAALEWIRGNIHAFGGDPARVTIAGESAGSVSVSMLMLCQQAWPLFRGAIMQSGAATVIHSREKSIDLAQRYAKRLGVNQGDREVLSTLSLKALFEAQGALGKEQRYGIPAAPWYDDDLLPASLQIARDAPTAPVPLLAGTTREESRLFEILPGNMIPLRRPDLEAILHAQLSERRAATISAAYPRTMFGRRALAKDLSFTIPTRNFAKRHSGRQPTWFYRFDYRHPLLGAFHGIDVAFEWPIQGLGGTLARGGSMTGKRAELARRFKAEIMSFIQNGSPSELWPAYTSDEQAVRLFDKCDRVVSNPDAERYAVWDGEDVYPRI